MFKLSPAIFLAALTASLLFATPAHAALPPGVSGAWFNASQSGHGLSIKIIAPDRALVFWYVYDLAGNPFNLYMDARIKGRRIEATALAPRGMRFGSFDPANLILPVWGDVTIDINDCDSGRLSWSAVDPSFGSGSIDIVRLVGIDAQDCQFGQAGPLPEGLYAADVTTRLTPLTPPRFLTAPGIAAVDPDGTLWGFEFVNNGNRHGPVPGPTSFDTRREVIQAHSIEQTERGANVIVRATFNNFARSSDHTLGPVPGTWQTAASGEELVYPGAEASQSNVTWAFRPLDGELVKPLTPERLEGTYSLALDGQFAATLASIEVGADASVCVRYAGGLCNLAGRYWLVDDDAGFFDFELNGDDTAISLGRNDLGRVDGLLYRGRGWLQRGADGDAIVLVGSDGYSGVGLIAR